MFVDMRPSILTPCHQAGYAQINVVHFEIKARRFDPEQLNPADRPISGKKSPMLCANVLQIMS